jgi:hypothetical protein
MHCAPNSCTSSHRKKNSSDWIEFLKQTSNLLMELICTPRFGCWWSFRAIGSDRANATVTLNAWINGQSSSSAKMTSSTGSSRCRQAIVAAIKPGRARGALRSICQALRKTKGAERAWCGLERSRGAIRTNGARGVQYGCLSWRVKSSGCWKAEEIL